MKRLIFSLCLLLCASLLLPACAGNAGTPEELLTDFCAAYGDMPAGHTYVSGAAEWEKGYLSPALADALFLEDNGENAFSLCREYAIFLSSSYEGGEIAFLRCSGRDDATRVAEMCAARLRRVRQVRPDGTVCKNACVLQHGSDVILLLLPDNLRAREICERLL